MLIAVSATSSFTRTLTDSVIATLLEERKGATINVIHIQRIVMVKITNKITSSVTFERTVKRAQLYIALVVAQSNWNAGEVVSKLSDYEIKEV